MFVNPDLAYDAANRLQDNGPQYSPDRPSAQQWQRMRQAVAFQMAFLGAPMIYYGSEAGMWSPDDPSNRQPMVWKDLEPYDDPQVRFDPAQFEAYQRAIAARSALPPLRTGFFRPVEIDDTGGVFSFVRELNDQHVYVVINRSDRTQTTTINVQTGGRYVDWLDPQMTGIRPPDSDSGRPALSVRAGARLLESRDGLLSIDLKPHGVAILSKAP
jgi:glycosidase